MKPPKFNFIPEKQIGNKLDGGGCWKVNVLASQTNPLIYFPTDMVHALEMDGKYYQIFADIEKRAIGWREIKDETTLETINGARKINKNKQTGAVLLGVGKLMKALKYELKESVKGLEVKVYSSPLIKESINYIVLPDIEVSL